MATTTTRRQTAANNALLAKVKRVMNGKIFKRAGEILNAEGEDAARAYLQQFFSRPFEPFMDEIVATLPPKR